MTSTSVPGPHVDWVTALGSTYRFLTHGEHVANGYAAMEEEFWGETTPLHSHPAAEEAFYVLSGQVEAWVDGTTTVASAGAFIVVPRGVPHALRRLSAHPVRLLTIASPPGLERVFPLVAEVGEAELLADPDRLAALARAHGTELLGDHPASGDLARRRDARSAAAGRRRPAVVQQPAGAQ